MFDRFTNDARRAVILAQEESRMLNHGHVGTEHLLLALTHSADTPAARALASCGVDHDSVRARIGELIGAGTSAHAGHLPFTPDARTVLEAAVREAIMLGHGYVGTEHLLLGLAAMNTGVAAVVVAGILPSMEQLRAAVLEAVKETGPEMPGHGFTLSA